MFDTSVWLSVSRQCKKWEIYQDSGSVVCSRGFVPPSGQKRSNAALKTLNYTSDVWDTEWYELEWCHTAASCFPFHPPGTFPCHLWAPEWSTATCGSWHWPGWRTWALRWDSPLKQNTQCQLLLNNAANRLGWLGCDPNMCSGGCQQTNADSQKN